MTIVFGTYSLKIKNWAIDDAIDESIGFKAENVEVRQVVFHLFYIPCFPLYKKYLFWKDGRAFEIPAEIQSVVKNVKTPKISFLFWMLTLIIGVVYLSITMVENHKRNIRYQNKIKNHKEKIERYLGAANNNTVFKVDNGRWKENDEYFKFGEIRNDTIFGEYVKINVIRGNEFDSLKYQIENDNTTKVKVSVESFKKAICYHICDKSNRFYLMFDQYFVYDAYDIGGE